MFNCQLRETELNHLIIIAWYDQISCFVFKFYRTITLKPGDVILTGTPAGVGMHRKPAEFLAAGDIIDSEIQSIGKIRNKVVADTA